MLIIGIDDAGRGPIIGPMFLAGVLVTQEQEKELKQEGVADSKTLLQSKRVKLAGIIKDKCIDYKVIGSTPEEIDRAVVKGGVNLNTLEAIKAAEIINHLVKGRTEQIRVILDCPSTNPKAWKATLMSFLEKPDDIEILCEHKADANHPSVSAASILAKCNREEAVEEIKKKYGEIGSGYPSDPYTKKFLQTKGKELENSGIFRKSWSTWKTLFPIVDQSTLEGF